MVVNLGDGVATGRTAITGRLLSILLQTQRHEEGKITTGPTLQEADVTNPRDKITEEIEAYRSSTKYKEQRLIKLY
jgi:hypothetical protein